MTKLNRKMKIVLTVGAITLALILGALIFLGWYNVSESFEAFMMRNEIEIPSVFDGSRATAKQFYNEVIGRLEEYPYVYLSVYEQEDYAIFAQQIQKAYLIEHDLLIPEWLQEV